MRGALHSTPLPTKSRARRPPSGALRALIHRHAAIHRALHSPRSSVGGHLQHRRRCIHDTRQDRRRLHCQTLGSFRRLHSRTHRSFRRLHSRTPGSFRRLHSRPRHPSAAPGLRAPPQHRLAALHPCSADGPHARGTVDDGSVSGRFVVATGRRAQSPVGRIPAGLDDRTDHPRRHRPSLGEVAATAMASATSSRTRFQARRRGRVPAVHRARTDDSRLPGGTPPRRGRVADRRTPEIRTRPRVTAPPARTIPGSTRQRRVGSPSSAGGDQIRLGTGAGVGTRAAPDRAVPGDECGSRSVHLRPRRPSQPNDHRSGRA
jgi:hypothetical protein